MTVLDKFVSFARALPADKLEAVEESLAGLMAALTPGHEFSPMEMAELDARLAETEPRYSDPAEIARLLGKPFRA